ncbi:hypothetical protein D3C83_105870 [compost metagenome]
MCPVPPVPAEAYEISPGRALASATSSFTDRTGSAGFTTSTCGTRHVSETAAKSLSGS